MNLGFKWVDQKRDGFKSNGFTILTSLTKHLMHFINV